MSLSPKIKNRLASVLQAQSFVREELAPSLMAENKLVIVVRQNTTWGLPVGENVIKINDPWLVHSGQFERQKGVFEAIWERIGYHDPHQATTTGSTNLASTKIHKRSLTETKL